MLLNEPGQTHYDFSFNLFGFNVRVHPGFFVLPFFFGAQAARGSVMNPGILILIFAIVMFISILIHELGHSVAFRFFGVNSRIVLHWMGGLAIPEQSWGSRSQLTHNQNIIVSLAGPFAGFALAAIFAGIVYAVGGSIQFVMSGIFPFFLPSLADSSIANNQSLIEFFRIGLLINIFWGILNLVPVIPLDGGQVCREVCLKFNPNNGMRVALLISMCVAILIAVIGLTSGNSMMLIFFGFMAYSSFATLQQMNFRGGGRW